MELGTFLASPSATFRVQVLVNERPVTFHAKGPNTRPYVIATPGESYVVKVTNSLGNRQIEVLLSVDGRDTQSAERASLQRNSGVLVPGGRSRTLDGWRQDKDTTHGFVFASVPLSVASQIGDAESNIGVIGVAAYREESKYPMYRPQPWPAQTLHPHFGVLGGENLRSSMSAESGLEGLLSSHAPSVGTGMGEASHSPVTYVDFRRESGRAPDIQAIGYGTLEDLVARGIVTPREPNPFPDIEPAVQGYNPEDFLRV